MFIKSDFNNLKNKVVCKPILLINLYTKRNKAIITFFKQTYGCKYRYTNHSLTSFCDFQTI